MSRVRLDDDGCSVNLDHIVTVEKKESGVVARLVSGNTVRLQEVYPVALEMVQVGLTPEVWVNPKYVSVVDVSYNKDEAFKAALAGKDVNDPEDFMQVRVVSILGDKHEVWADVFGNDEVDYLADLLLEVAQ